MAHKVILSIVTDLIFGHGFCFIVVGVFLFLFFLSVVTVLAAAPTATVLCMYVWKEGGF